MANDATQFYQIRGLRAEETPLLENFLYEAIFIPEGVAPPPCSVVRDSSLSCYIDAFGSGACDHALVAVLQDGTVAGAVWTRLLADRSPLAGDVPTLAIAVLPAYRSRGIGTALLHAMLKELASHGWQQVALSVQKANPALRLYQRTGFNIVKDNGEELVMVCETKSCNEMTNDQ
ncbi:MAG: GNAT family N-acetyltransferase [Peptococcaceae bacterium]|nr:GNAT family N-acetyltransferase [Peptococcaceae bacterium]